MHLGANVRKRARHEILLAVRPENAVKQLSRPTTPTEYSKLLPKCRKCIIFSYCLVTATVAKTINRQGFMSIFVSLFKLYPLKNKVRRYPVQIVINRTILP